MSVALLFTIENNHINYFDYNNKFLLKRLILILLVSFFCDRPLNIILFVNIIMMTKYSDVTKISNTDLITISQGSYIIFEFEFGVHVMAFHFFF